MGLWEQFGNAFQNENRIPNIPDIPKIGVSGTPKSNCGDNEDIGDIHSSLKNVCSPCPVLCRGDALELPR